ncbi:TPA: hypothetical protein DDZ86_01340 [Candidatus Dependentiae bacterium]|nr:hypothetical protein [Candidatus Dependentiae bacterium]
MNEWENDNTEPTFNLLDLDDQQPSSFPPSTTPDPTPFWLDENNTPIQDLLAHLENNSTNVLVDQGIVTPPQSPTTILKPMTLDPDKFFDMPTFQFFDPDEETEPQPTKIVEQGPQKIASTKNPPIKRKRGSSKKFCKKRPIQDSNTTEPNTKTKKNLFEEWNAIPREQKKCLIYSHVKDDTPQTLSLFLNNTVRGLPTAISHLFCDPFSTNNLKKPNISSILEWAIQNERFESLKVIISFIVTKSKNSSIPTKKQMFTYILFSLNDAYSQAKIQPTSLKTESLSWCITHLKEALKNAPKAKSRVVKKQSQN